MLGSESGEILALSLCAVVSRLPFSSRNGKRSQSTSLAEGREGSWDGGREGEGEAWVGRFVPSGPRTFQYFSVVDHGNTISPQQKTSAVDMHDHSVYAPTGSSS